LNVIFSSSSVISTIFQVKCLDISVFVAEEVDLF
jgi:hypothetical protein